MSENVAKRRPVAVVTASYSGLGAELGIRLAKEGYDLVLVNRDPVRASKQARELRALEPAIAIDEIEADLSDHRMLRRAAEKIAGKHARVELLIHNAGVLSGLPKLSSQGNDLHYEVNTVAPYLLTGLLRPLLAAAGRSVVVAVGSSAMKMARRVETGELRKPVRLRKFAPYVQSKLATALVFDALAGDYAREGILLRVVDPGPSRTSMSRNGALPGAFRLLRPFFKTPAAGAERIYAAATASEFGDRSGVYIERGKISRIPPYLVNAGTQRELLELLRQSTEEAGA